MSGRKAKVARLQRRSRSERQVNVDKILATTSEVLGVDFSDLPTARAVQVPVGWLRAMMQQSRAIVTLSEAALDGATAPNRRSASEILLRLQWLATLPPEKRADAIDAMIDEEKRLTENHKVHVVEMGLTEPPDLGNVDAVITLAGDDTQIKQQAKSIKDAAAAATGVGLYRAWRDETQMAHATVQLAAAHAPVRDNRFERGIAPERDQDLSLTLNLAAFAVMYASRLLLDAGVDKDSAFRFFNSFFDGIRKAI